MNTQQMNHLNRFMTRNSFGDALDPNCPALYRGQSCHETP
jgi:hypothetical protein